MVMSPLFQSRYKLSEASLIQTLNRGIVVELVDTVWVHENGEITVDFNFADEFFLKGKMQGALDASPMRGPTGPTGPTGPQGPAGPAGGPAGPRCESA